MPLATTPPRLARYDPHKSYHWNYDHAPDPVDVEVPDTPGPWTFCGLAVASPLGIAAGPLLNGRWLLYYAGLGFDVVTYKTVRSVARASYAMPNLVSVRSGQLAGTETRLPAAEAATGSWAVSFGMPSQAPEVWRADVAAARSKLARGKVLSVSVVGSVQPGWTIDDLAADYAQTARWAVESGADAIETNFSCPNVSTCDGQLYEQPASAALVAQRVRAAIGGVPYVIKVGHLAREEEAAALVEAVAPHADALATTNSVAATVVDGLGRLLFDGQRRGICGACIRQASVRQTSLLAGLIARRGLGLRVIGVGGVASAQDVQEYLAAGAQGVHLATAAMLNPALGLEIRRRWRLGHVRAT